jgi:hypothetical protein
MEAGTRSASSEIRPERQIVGQMSAPYRLGKDPAPSGTETGRSPVWAEYLQHFPEAGQLFSRRSRSDMFAPER